MPWLGYEQITAIARGGGGWGGGERWPLLELTDELKILAIVGSFGEKAPHFDRL